jgi:uncharacterized membrane protein YdjX (TVP38/TMEM64 family)
MRRLLRSRGLQSFLLSLAMGVALLLWVRSIGGPAAVRQRYGTWAPTLSFFLHTLVDTTPFGDLIPFAIANGAAYGPVLGAGLSWAAWIASSALQYLIARRTACDLELSSHLDGLPRWLRRIPLGHPAFLIAARWVPLGGAVANVAAGVLGVGLHRLLACVAIGAAPPAILLAALGAGLLHLM